MKVREKQDDENYLEISLTEDEIKGLTEGCYPYINKVINGKRYTISVGIMI